MVTRRHTRCRQRHGYSPEYLAFTHPQSTRRLQIGWVHTCQRRLTVLVHQRQGNHRQHDESLPSGVKLDQAVYKQPCEVQANHQREKGGRRRNPKEYQNMNQSLECHGITKPAVVQVRFALPLLKKSISFVPSVCRLELATTAAEYTIGAANVDTGKIYRSLARPEPDAATASDARTMPRGAEPDSTKDSTCLTLPLRINPSPSRPGTPSFVSAFMA